MLGTSLVANNLVKAEPYVEWVQAIAREAPVTYWAHRREDARTLGPLGRTPGIEITAGQIPVELSLRGVTSHRLITLPTTAATTLRMLVPGVNVHEYAVPESWWQPRRAGGGAHAPGAGPRPPAVLRRPAALADPLTPPPRRPCRPSRRNAA